MHDIAHHIENVLGEVTEYLAEPVKTNFQQAITTAYEEKSVKRCSDHRLALLTVLAATEQNLPLKVRNILLTLAEIQKIVYDVDKNRDNKQILRLHNLVFLHQMTLKKLVGTKPRSATARKFYGKYYHDIVRHAPLQQRVVCGESANTEDEERCFNQIKSITNQTTNRHNENILFNIFIRIQMEQQTSRNKSNQDESKIGRLWSVIDHKQNTRVSVDIIDQNQRDWQAHLLRIADYLVEG